MTINVTQLAAALRLAADALEGVESAPAEAAAPAKRGRGRPVKGEEPAAPAAPAAAPAPEAPAPAPAPAPEPVHTHAQVREALTNLRLATSQDKAVEVLKTVFVGAFNDLPKDKFDAVVAAAKAAMPAPAAPVVEDDPFGLPPEAPAAAVVYTLEDVKKACVDAQKRGSAEAAQKLVMKHGGIVEVAGKPPGPSLKALDPSVYATIIAQLAALPTTK